jgi:hypothetical protein
MVPNPASPYPAVVLNPGINQMAKNHLCARAWPIQRPAPNAFGVQRLNGSMDVPVALRARFLLSYDRPKYLDSERISAQ